MSSNLASTAREFNFFLPSAFAVMFATAAFGASNYPDRAPRKSDFTVLSVKEPSTNSRQFQVNRNAELSTILPNTDSDQEVLPDGILSDLGVNWLVRADFPNNWIELVQELESFSTFSPGWHGDGSMALTQDTEKDARTLLHKLAWANPAGFLPMVGMDSEGSIVLTWDNQKIVGSLSVFGDGTFAYYIERGGEVRKDGATDLTLPLPEQFLSILAA
ncbi:MAG: hypothetical protein JWS10_917 [Cypionkella sp.]|uniref:hypothetical protein n=1 Tax=Cypionkella sp. TaxID=2811411 RepID=UPI0026124850|nr:hypothetical protein [Cypionkella sp.]MDB5658302.1 hypothetical protein [Cypionkella sp.]